MLNSNLTLKKEIILHIVFWLIFLYFNITSMDIDGKLYFKNGIFPWTWILVNILTFYVNYIIVLPKVFKPFQWKNLFLGLAIMILFFIGIRYFTEQFLTDFLLGKQNYYNTKLAYYLYDNIFFAIKPIIMSTIFWLIIFMIRLSDYNRLILEENKNTEIKFLKAQINPHFVFNTLNNIYSMVYFNSEKSLLAIEKLCQIMRFTSYESQREKIKLSEEINYVQALVELEQLRHQKENLVQFNLNVENDQVFIAPFIISPLVENALKHGLISKDKLIEISLSSTYNELIIEISNEIGNQKKDRLGGIGLDNLKKRLEIHYPEHYSLSICKENNKFNASLHILFQ